jgi:hypothetical protein
MLRQAATFFLAVFLICGARLVHTIQKFRYNFFLGLALQLTSTWVPTRVSEAELSFNQF